MEDAKNTYRMVARAVRCQRGQTIQDFWGRFVLPGQILRDRDRAVWVDDYPGDLSDKGLFFRIRHSIICFRVQLSEIPDLKKLTRKVAAKTRKQAARFIEKLHGSSSSWRRNLRLYQ